MFRCLTDNGSKIVKAFKILQHDKNAENSNSEVSQPGTEDLVDADNESNDSCEDSEDDANFEEASVIGTMKFSNLRSMKKSMAQHLPHGEDPVALHILCSWL